jgi:hypothetical protein
MNATSHPIELSVEEALAVLSHTARIGYPTGHQKRLIAAAHNIVREAAIKAEQREWMRTLWVKS